MTTYTESHTHDHQHPSAPSTDHHASPMLVIGYGNALRGDDAVGQLVAERVGTWDLPDVEVVVVHQLMPELAEKLAEAECAIFIDARVVIASDERASNGYVTIRPIAPDRTNASLGHISDPRELLMLAKKVYGRHPRAWYVSIPAAQFGFGTDLSSETETGMRVALHAIHYIITKAGRHARNEFTAGHV